MRYIKARFKLNAPCKSEYTVFGFDTEWLGKATIHDGAAVEPGDIVQFQPLTVQPNGRFVCVATKRNIEKLKGMIRVGQAILAPGEALEAAQTPKKAAEEESWPEPPMTAEAREAAEEKASLEAIAEDAEFRAVEKSEIIAATGPNGNLPEEDEDDDAPIAQAPTKDAAGNVVVKRKVGRPAKQKYGTDAFKMPERKA